MHAEFNPRDIGFIIGIGNPGETYERTYHNAGLRAVKRLAPDEWTAPASKHFLYAKAGRFTYGCSATFMNESGRAVSEFCSYFKTEPERLLLVHDDSDIRLGDYKFSFGRGSAGHAGVESVIAALGTDKFWRLRIGIRDENEKRKAEDFVLRRIPKRREQLLETVFETIRRTLEANTQS